MATLPPLPPTEIRQGGGPLRYDDDFFMKSAQESVSLWSQWASGMIQS